MIRKILYILIFVFVSTLFLNLDAKVFSAETKYTALSPIPGLTSSDVTLSTSGDKSGTGLSEYIEGLYKWGVGLTSGLAVLVIMWGGVGYMTSAGGSGVEEAKGRISAALTGLMLALGSFIILQTINKDLLKTTFELSELTVTSSTSSTNTSTSNTSSSEITKYTALSPIPGLTSSDVTLSTSGDKSGTGLSEYIEGLYKWGVGLTSGLAVLVIMWGGVGYMTSAGGSGVEEAKGRISAALTGLMLALGSFIILQTINKDLLKTTFELSELTVTSTSGTSGNSYVSTTGGTSSGTSASGTTSTGSGTSGTGATGTGSIATNALNGMTFPDQSLNDYTLQQISSSGLLDMNPSDAAKYFPNGQVTAEGYVSVLASIAESESSFNATDNNNHAHVDYTDKETGLPVYSEGLYSLSETDSAVKSVASQNGVSVQQVLSNANYSTQAAISILKSQIQSQGTITGGATTGYWGPLRRGE